MAFLFITVHESPADTVPFRIQPAGQLAGEYVTWIRKVADWQLGHSSWNSGHNWHHGTLFAGMMAAYEATRNPVYLDATRQWAEQNNWRLVGGEFSRHADHHAAGQAYLEMFLLDKQDSIRYQHTKAVNDYIVNYPRHFACNIAGGSEVWWWCDALFMQPPILARLAYLFNDPSYIDLMHMMWLQTQDCLYDPEEHLFYRDINFLETRIGDQKVFWSRGNGWVTAGIVRVLQYLPPDDSRRPHYVTLLEDMAERLVGIQQPDGYWYANLLYPEQFDVPETSGTAFFCYALAWGVNAGILDADVYWPAAQNAWEALKAAVHDNGMLGWVQPVGYQPERPSWDDTHVYGVGAFLLAASEIQKYVNTQASSHIDYFEAYDSDTSLKNVWISGTDNDGTAQISLGNYGDRFMVFQYSGNTSPSNVWTERNFTTPMDWTVENFNTFSVLVQGRSDNAPGQLYVRLFDENNNTSVIYVTDENVVQQKHWQEIAFDLSAFEGVDTTRIAGVRLGISASVGIGKLRVDTLRLHPTRCYEKIVADFTGDCRVDMGDIAILAAEWMEVYTHLIVPNEPDPSKLSARWRFDETSGNSAFDAVTGQLNSGTLYAAEWAPQEGRLDGAVRLKGAKDNRSRVSIPTSPLTLESCTISMWVRLDNQQTTPAIRYVFGHTGLPPWQQRIQLYMDNSNTVLNLGLGDSHTTQTEIYTLPINVWTHIALTLKNNQYAVYVNGQIKAEGTYTGLTQLQNEAHIGNNGGDEHTPGNSQQQAFNGWIDDVRIYLTALTPGEILYLAEGISYTPKPVRLTDLTSSGCTGIEDLHMFLSYWGQSNLWPDVD